MSNPFIIIRSWSNCLFLTFHLLLLGLLHPSSSTLLLLLCETIATFDTPSLFHDKGPLKRVVTHLTSIDLLFLRCVDSPTTSWLLSLMLLGSVRGGGACEARETFLYVSLNLLFHLVSQLFLLRAFPIFSIFFHETSDIACFNGLIHVFICYGGSSQDSLSWYYTHIHNIFIV
jgi:hypothetical protein